MKKTIQLKITGMSCTSCVLHIEKDLERLDGVLSSSINFAMERGSVTFDTDKTSLEQIIATIKKTGYTAEVIEQDKMQMEHKGHSHHSMSENHSEHAQAEGSSQIRERLIRLIVAAVLSIVILFLGFVWKIDQGMEIMMILSLIIILYSGREFLQKGIPALLKGRPGMDTLVILGVGAAFLYSSYITLFTDKHEEYFMDAAIITTFILLGRYLEAKAKGKASEAIKKLLALSAKIAHRLRPDGSTEDIPADQVQVGDQLKVLPGEKIPVDGVILKGESNINESMVTGESIPVDKRDGDSIIGATINGNSSFVMEAKKVGAETMLAQIAKMVQEAQMSKAPIQKLVDVISGYFVWGVIAIATTTFFVWGLVIGAEPAIALIYTVAVLIIACPCALGLATPISIVTGSGKGAQMGILIKKSESLEKTHKITTIAFDKTGTITKGEPEVQEIKIVKGKQDEVLKIALALESNSEHPLAKSIVQFAKTNIKTKPEEVEKFEAITGLGVKGIVDKNLYHLGSSRYMEELKILTDSPKKQIDDWQEKGYTVLVLANEKEIIALFGVQDGVKETSAQAIHLLKKENICTVMITGDNEKVAQKIANDVGIDEVHSGVAPDQKKGIIENLQKEGQFVAMVGDGINDSPALAQADVGIAMGTGTDIAMETGDLILVKGDLMKAVEAIKLSRATLRNIKQNLFWAFAYNSFGIPLAAIGFLTPAFSAAAMAFSSISVVLNALRLKRFKA